MRSILGLFILSLFLIACSSPQTIEVGGTTLNYDSSVWKTFSNEGTTGLIVKGDDSCWIDLTGDRTEPYEGLEAVSDENSTLYFRSEEAIATYVSFEVGSKTLYGRVSTNTPEVCVNHLMNLAAAN